MLDLAFGMLLFALASIGLLSVTADAVPNATPEPSPTPQFYLPLVKGNAYDVGGECQTHSASMRLAATATTIQVGETVTLTAALSNDGCADLGLPLYRLYIENHGTASVFDPDPPEPVTHYLGIPPGASDAVEFVRTATSPGQATLRVTASFEVHLGYPGPAYWSGSSTEPLEFQVTAR
jgi:hypothetical protein